MYQIGDVVVYGKNGVCRITEIGPLNLSMVDPGKEYYTLHPIYRKDSTLYAPVENGKTVMRAVMTDKEAEALIDEMTAIDCVWDINEKERENFYKDALASCDCRELVKIIKTIYARRESRLQDGKKVTVVDERYFKLAEDQLYEEMAHALGKDKKDMVEYILNRIEGGQ